MIKIHFEYKAIKITGTHEVDGADSYVCERTCSLLEPLRVDVGAPAFDFWMDELGVEFVGMLDRNADDAIVISNLPYPRPAWFDHAMRDLVATANGFSKARTADLVPTATMPPVRRKPVLRLPDDAPKWLETKQLAFHVGVTRKTLNLWCRFGKFPAPVKVGSRNHWRRDDVLAWFGVASG